MISNKLNKWLIYELLKSCNYRYYVKEVASGTSILMLKKEDLDLFEIQIPPVELLINYTNIISGIYSKVDINFSNIKTLGTIRDTLLPKLMRGEVRVGM